MLKTVKTMLAKESVSYKVPRKVQDFIDIDSIWEDGIFRRGQVYSVCFKFSDVNYVICSEEQRAEFLNAYQALLKCLPDDANTKITIYRRPITDGDYRSGLLIPLQGKPTDVLIEELNELVKSSSNSEGGGILEKYITVAVPEENYMDAREAFRGITQELARSFFALGSHLIRLNATERLQILHGFYRPDDRGIYAFDYKEAAHYGIHFKDYICPDTIEKQNSYMVLGSVYCRTFFIKAYPTMVQDDFLDKVSKVCRNVMLSMDLLPIPTEEAVREVEAKLLGIDTNIANWQRRQNKNYNFAATLPMDYSTQKSETENFLGELTNNDDKMIMTVITIAICADSLGELERYSKDLISLGKGKNFQISVLKYQQDAGLNTVLPIGTRRIEAFRTLITESLSIFVPFKAMEIQEKGGMYFGTNRISGSAIVCNRAMSLMNQACFVFGVSGCGKSFLVKLLLLYIFFSTKDDILICDPEGEYTPLVEELGEQGAILRIMAGGKDRLNPMDIVFGNGEEEEDPVTVKTQLILTLLDLINKTPIESEGKSIIDRCVRAVYDRARSTGDTPTLTLLREELLKQKESIAQKIALSLERFTLGNLNCFGRESNVNLNRRVTAFDIHKLGEEMKPLGLLMVTDTIMNRVAENWKKGKRTHVFIDECHVVFNDPGAASFFCMAWKQFRKRNASLTAITQNIDYVLRHPEGKTMISNSEQLIMLNQSSGDLELLTELLDLNEQHKQFLTNTAPGTGLLRYGKELVPFENHIPKNSKLYDLMTTSPGEGAFAKRKS